MISVCFLFLAVLYIELTVLTHHLTGFIVSVASHLVENSRCLVVTGCHAVCGLGAIPTRWSTLWIHTSLFPLLDSTVMDFLLVGSNVSFICLFCERCQQRQPVCFLILFNPHFPWGNGTSSTTVLLIPLLDQVLLSWKFAGFNHEQQACSECFLYICPTKPVTWMWFIPPVFFFSSQSNHCNSSTCTVFLVKGCCPFGQSQQSWS